MSTTLDSLRLISRYFEVRPVLQAVWCIDRPYAYTVFVDLLASSKGNFPLYGPQLFHWTIDEMHEHIAKLLAEGTQQATIDMHLPFREAGIWLQMSNGKHKHYNSLADMQGDKNARQYVSGLHQNAGEVSDKMSKVSGRRRQG